MSQTITDSTVTAYQVFVFNHLRSVHFGNKLGFYFFFILLKTVIVICVQCSPTLWKACLSRGKEQEAAMEEGYELLKTLEKELKNKRFFGGDSIGLVDIVANFIGFWIGVAQDANGVEFLTEEKFPILCKWINEYVNCSIIKSNLPPRDQLFAFFKARSQAA